jgi:flagellar biosynthesis component FlhA
VLFIIALLMVPLPGILLDLFLAMSIGMSIVVLLVSLYNTDPLEFSGFPSLLLLLTLFRLALNVCSTRLILSDGHAGAVIQAFGEFVIGGNYVVGTRALPDSHRHQLHRHHERCRAESPKSRRASRWTRCPASRWRSTPI